MNFEAETMKIRTAGTNPLLQNRLSGLLKEENVPEEILLYCGSETELEEVVSSFSGNIIFLSDARNSLDLKRLKQECYEEYETRFRLTERQELPGVSGKGIDESFQPAVLPDRVILNRCAETGGRAAEWLEGHRNGTKSLRYVSFGGSGKQVFDLLDCRDLAALLRKQCSAFRPGLYHVSGGLPASVSLLELTAICECATGRILKITDDESRSDVPVFLLNSGRAEQTFDWKPEYGAEEIIREWNGKKGSADHV